MIPFETVDEWSPSAYETHEEYLYSQVCSAADLVAAQEQIHEAAAAAVIRAKMQGREREEGEVWEIDLKEMKEYNWLMKFWGRLVKAVANYNAYKQA
jgi:hypothetical protein